MKEAYQSILCVRTKDRTHKTGKGAMWETPQECVDDFNSRRYLSVEGDEYSFLLDLYIDNDLVDTITLNIEGYKAVVGEEPPSMEECAKFDKEYWDEARAHYNKREKKGGK